MADKNFAADFRRMTGKYFSGSPSDYLQIMLRHNLRFAVNVKDHRYSATVYLSASMQQSSETLKSATM